MKILKKLSLLLTFGFIGLFITSCNGTTSIYGIEHKSKHKSKSKKYPRYDVKYETKRKDLPPGHKKKVYGEQSARRYAPGHQKHKNYKSSHKKGKGNYKGGKGKNHYGKKHH
ncbi:hypothetical protein [Faecalibacter macacae]|uniref:Quinol oxidase subunit 4 n=1 Tax=Faecalibacter macacae TaxID=1859289 RepID=A0A3L9M918_9FLAO|nr:hypothetical protein [Faecalibacter macacae]RLZ07019.1 hypothetical protein EAH69_12260 [Faecalibacter macacae]